MWVKIPVLPFSELLESHTDGVSLYNTIDDPIGYFDFQCTGIESDLASCSSNGLSPSTCSTNTPAKIKCTPKGTCESAGHTSCCNSSPCSAAGGCMCDFACYSYGTCCNDIALVCPLDYTGSFVYLKDRYNKNSNFINVSILWFQYFLG